ncbi:MAG TPA: GNAT family protein [Ktedonobacterales bacterium]|nr:GNAT family protein [Ktedonobacterales bacterium]
MFAFEEFPTLTTERLILREMRQKDAPDLLAILGDSEVTRYLDLSSFTELAQAETLIERLHASFQAQERWRWGIALQHDDRLIGTGGFIRWNRGWQSAEIGYDLAHAYWRQGFMSEALRAMLTFGFEQMELHRVEAEVMPENQASARMLAKLGFRYEGTLRQRGFWKGAYHDLEMHALLREEYIE